MKRQFLTGKAAEALRTIKALRKLPGDTSRAQEKVLRSAIKQIPPMDQSILALEIEELAASPSLEAK